MSSSGSTALLHRDPREPDERLGAALALKPARSGPQVPFTAGAAHERHAGVEHAARAPGLGGCGKVGNGGIDVASGDIEQAQIVQPVGLARSGGALEPGARRGGVGVDAVPVHKRHADRRHGPRKALRGGAEEPVPLVVERVDEVTARAADGVAGAVAVVRAVRADALGEGEVRARLLAREDDLEVRVAAVAAPELADLGDVDVVALALRALQPVPEPRGGAFELVEIAPAAGGGAGSAEQEARIATLEGELAESRAEKVN